MIKQELSAIVRAAANRNLEERDYWLKKLSGIGVIEKGIFPYDCDLKKVENQEERTASASKDKEIETVRFVFPGEIYAKLMELGKSSDYVLHIYLAAGLVLLLNRYTGINDIIIGTPIYKQAVEGTLINRAVALRNQLEDNMTVKELLLQMRRTIAEAIENQNYPVEMLPGLLNLPGEGDKFPLFDTAILLEMIHDKEYLKHIDNNMTFSFNRNDGSLDGTVQYNPGFYKRTTIERIVKHFIKLLNQAINNMDSSLACLEMVSGEERKQIFCAIKNKKSVIPPDQAIRELSTEQLAGAVFLVLDRNLDLSPVNVQGELYIASPGLEGDCPDQNESTPGKFVENPYASDLFGPGTRNKLMYKTGALACRLPDGTIRFPGKRAGSVKIKEVDGYVAPGNEVEKKLVEVWAEVLKIEKEKIGINSNFFDLGGNSLKIVDMKSKLGKEFKIELPVAKLFEHSTISFLAHYLKEMEADKRIPGEVLEDREQPGKSGSQDQSFKEIAVIGMSLRFPGAKTKEVFWNNLKEGKETISFFSEEELLNAGLSPGLVNHPGYVKAASILEDKEFFDAHFFDYVPKEAELMDPQIRIFHEISWEALEDSGIDPDSYNGLIGVYAGAVQNLEWESRVLVSGKTSSFGSFITTRLTGIRFLCTRLSYNLNLKGPSVTVQTACSTSLVAIHMACRALTNGECDIALAGGIAVSAADRMGYLSQEGMIFSMDGHNRSFDAKGSGSIFGEGAGVVVLKPLEKARLNRDHIYAVIKGSAINNDGSRKVGFTAPSVSGQAEVIRAAHQAAGVEPRSISYVETHGTATSLGDPIEVEALGQAFNTGKKISCNIGSIKSNFGHLDTAAGVAGFIKTVLLLKNKMIPPTLHFETPNPEINFADTPFEVNTRLTELKRDAYPLRAGVSSMGIGGTNAHVILEEAVEREESPESRKYHIILLSTKSETSLDGAHKNLVDFLKNNNSINLADVAYTLQVGRKVFPSRRMAVCQDTPQAIAQLSSPGSSKVKTFHTKKEAGPVIFMFPGLGSHYVNMGLELYQTEDFFRREMDHCFDILKPILEVDVKEILYPQEQSTQTPGHKKNNIHQNEIAQVTVFIFEYALARLLMHWGIEPQAMIGYSFGEYVAACIGGVFSLEEALTLVVSRGQLIGRLASGAMTSVPLGENQVKPLLNNELSLAVDNGESCIISGPKEAIAEFEKQVKENRGICMRLPNTHALHSHMMEPILTDFEEKVKQISLNKPKIPFISNVTGQWLTGEQAVDPGYWAMHLRHTVRFADGIKELVKKSKAIFVETGAGGDLSALLQRYINKDSGQKVVNLVRQASNEVSDVYYLFRQLGKLWLYGKKINWHNFYAREKRHIISLPTYPFEGRRFWIDKPSQARVMESISREFPSRNGTDHFDNFFTTFWKPSALVAQSCEHISPQACRLVFMNEDSLSDRLTKRLETGGSEVFRIMTGTGFKKMDEYTYTLNPREINHYHRLMKELRAMGKIPFSIVHLWNVMEKEDRVSGFAWVDQVQDLGLNSLLFLAQALKHLNLGDADHSQLAITVVTHRMQKVPGQASGYPEKATLLGFVNIISKDNPHIKCRSIDIVSPAPGSWQEESLVEQLAAEIISIPAEPVIALRDRDRLVPALQPIPAELCENNPNAMPGLKKEGVYLITGGLERPGLSFAQYLGRTMQAKLVLIKWTFPNLENRENQIEIIKLRQLEDLGAKVLVLSVDAAHPEQIREMVALAEEKFGQINGVIHTTGYYDESERITEISREMIDNVLTSLLKGTIALENAFSDAPLDFFAICSTSGSHPQTLNLLRNEAANSFLDLFAAYRAPQKKFPITSVNWIQSQQVEDEIISKRIEDVFNIILNTSFSRVRVRLESIKKDKIQPQAESLEEKPPRTLINRPDLNSQYTAPRNKAEQLMVNMWEEILGVTPIGIHDNFFEMGVDSLRRFAFTNKLQELFGEIIHIAAIFDAPTVAELSDYFRKNYQEGYAKMMAGETVGKETGMAPGEVTIEKLEIVKSMLTPLAAPAKIETPKNSSAVFILSPPRTGSTLLRVMLAGHPRLLAPPELNLLIHNTLSDRRTAISDRSANHLQGAIHAIKQIKACSAREAEKMMADFENQGMTVKQFYHWMQECIAQRKQVLVDKSPVYSLYPGAMKRAELYFRDPLYIFLVRHPYGMIRSFIEAKMDLLLGQDLIEKLSLSRQEIAEMTWTIRVRNILDFLKNVPANRQHWIKFEDLTEDPEKTIRDICKFLNLEFNPEMLQPYKEKNKRMTEGLHPGGVMLGDMKFHRHKKIDRTVGDTWKSYYTTDFWGEPTRQLAKKFGYKSIRELQEENILLEDKNLEMPAPTLLPQLLKDPLNNEEVFPLSLAQERLWFLNRLDGENTSYNSLLGLELKGRLDVDALSRSIDEIVRRHTVLRATFTTRDGKPVQVIGRSYHVPLLEKDFQHLGKDEQSERVHAVALKEVHRPFDLEKGPLIWACLLRLGFDHHVLLVIMHHIITDAWSRGIFFREISALYNAFSNGLPSPLPDLPIQHSDFTLWQREQYKKGELEPQLHYWKKQLGGAPQLLELPLDRPRPPVQTYRGTRTYFTVNNRLTKKLKQLSQETGTTLYMILLAAFALLLSRLSGQDDIVIGSPIANRSWKQIESLIGFFVNTLAMRIHIPGDFTYKELLSHVRQVTLDAYANQDLPFEKLVEELHPQRNLSYNPLFQVMFQVGNIPSRKIERTNLSISLLKLKVHTVKFDLLLEAAQTKEGIKFECSYSTELFDRETIERYIKYFKIIISTAAVNFNKRLSEIEIITNEEKKQVLYEFNDTAREYPGDKTIHKLFEEQVETSPDHMALIGPSVLSIQESPLQITYRELNEKSAQLAYVLRQKGIQPDTIVGILAERSIEMVFAILGILKAGGAYLPIAPEYPHERIDYMSKDSGAKILVKIDNLSKEDEKVRRWEGEKNLEIVFLNTLSSAAILNPDFPDFLTSQPPNSHPLPVTGHRSPAASLAYIIYTSGSTGKPKGVLIMHYNVARMVRNTNYIEIKPEDRVLQLSNYAFDGAVFDIYGALLNSSALVMLCREDVLEVDRLANLIKREVVTVFFVTTALFNTLVDLRIDCFDRIRKVLFGGERVSVEHSRQALEYMGKGRIIHVYGPTETTVYSSYYFIDEVVENAATIPIGRPLANTSIYILDRYVNLLPVGVQGEIYIGGEGTARGYLNNPELTAEKFVINSKFKTQNSILYKTGDLARWLADGDIEFQGRIDHQVKIRGFRIECGEVENCLRRIENIKEVVVIDRTDEKGDKYLVAYIVSDKTFDTTEVRNILSQSLPDYMIPSYFIPLEVIPLTPNGKIDRELLPGPEGKASCPGVEEYAAPRDKIEGKLVDIWYEILGGSGAIGIDANFFELGGHSLKATILTSEIHKELSVKIPLAEVFKRQTIRGLSEYIRGCKEVKFAEINPVEAKEYYPLSSAQKRLYFLQQFDLNSIVYNMPLVFPIGKGLEKDGLEFTLKQLIVRHESLRTSFVKVHEEVVQKIHTAETIHFSFDYYEVDESRGQEIIKHYIKPFDLAKAPLIRSGIIKLPDGHQIWIVDVHHVVSDGLSHTILKEDFMSLYNSYKGNKGIILEPLRVQYKDFTQWQNRLFEGGEIKAQEEYWLELHRGEISRLNLPTDFKRPEVFTFAGDHYGFNLAREDAERIKVLGSHYGGTLYMNILAVLNTVFYKYTGQTDIIIGSGIAGRRHADLQGVVGMFVNTLVMRNYPAGEQSYEDFLQEVITGSVKGFENQDVQFEELVEKLEVERDPSRNPLFDISMVVQNFRRPGAVDSSNSQRGNAAVLPQPEKNVPTIGYDYKTSKFDMTFFVHELLDDVSIKIEYYTGIFKAETIRRLSRHFRNVIKVILENPSIKLKDIVMMSAEEKRQVLYEFNDTAQDYPREKTIHEIFAGRAAKTPDHAALIYEDQMLTYKELDRQANRMARYLYGEKDGQPGKEEAVGIFMTQSLSRPISILGVLKAGKGYIPIDSFLPLERIKFMINDSQTGTIISEKKFIKTLNRLQWECDCFCRYLCIDSFDIGGEEEEEKSELMNEELWRHVGETAVDEITGGGWLSSYTGEPLSRKEMDEYGDNIFKKLEPLLQPRLRVLEIGCASGISMYRIAPRVGLYYGTDLSGVIINRNKQRVEEEGHQNIKLANLPAHEIHRLEERNFDLIIMNSVIQCFHGHNYLGKVIRQCIAMLGETGHLFIGDIMDQEKKDALTRELVDFKYTNRDKNYTTKTDLATELFLSRGYWQDLELELKEIEKIEFSDKIYTVENELTRYRYDALVTVNKRRFTNKNRKKRKYQHDVPVLSSFTSERFQLDTFSSSAGLAYIIYTSGTTGKPKGVMIDHYSLINLCTWYNGYYSLTPGERSTQYASFGFDASVWETFPALIGGAASYLIPEEIKLDIQALNDYLEKNDISIVFLPTPICEQFMTLDNRRLRVVQTAGDKLKIFIKRDYQLYNNYGPTENTVCATCCRVTEQAANIPIGKPIFNNRIYIVDENGEAQAIGIPGEICLGGDGVARGYLNNPELTFEKFCLRRPGGSFRENHPLDPHKSFLLNQSPIYKTGDLGRWLPDGKIEFLGRIDHQIKIRGFRIESGEVENCLRRIEHIKEVVVIDRADEKGDKYLAAYIVAGKTLETTGLRDFLSGSLPEYMIPSYFVFLEKIPLTPNGKIDRKALPIPEMQAGENYTAPGDEIEKKLVEIWSGILGIEKEKIGINDNFFHLGGHSLKATILISSIHRELDIKVPLAEVFRAPSVSGLSEYIKSAIKDKYKRIEAVEKKEYYPVFSAQKRVYLSHHIDQGNVGYNQINAVPLGKKIKIEKLKSSLKKLVHRHESLRTSFEMVKGQLVQRIHKDFSFDIEHFRLNKRTGNPDTSPLQLEELIVDFIKPFDLSEPPLIRIGLVETAKGEHILIFDIHHIITDGRSMKILTKDFIFLYNDKELFPMRLQFKDFSNWYNRPQNKISIKEQEQFWTGRFRDKITLLNLPTDFKRPTVLTSEGDIVGFNLDSQTIGELGSIQIETNTTMFMVLIAIYSVFLAKITNQEDILVGVPIAGRRHSDLQQITGMFVNTLVMRSQPTKDKSFREFLRQMKEYALAAFENQEYQFENLVELVAVKRDAGRNPIFDTMFSYGHIDKKEKGDTELVTGQYGRKYKAALFDLSLEIVDQKDTLTCTFYYNLNLFKKRTILRFVRYFLGTIDAIVKRPGIKLGKIDILPGEEKQRFLEKINSTGEKYRQDKTVPGLFEEQTTKTPGQVALILTENHYTYGYINERSTRLAHFLASGRGIKSNSLTGLWVEKSAWGFIGFLGILKAGAAYIPMEPSTPPTRLEFILADSRCQRVLTDNDDTHQVTKGAAVELTDIEKASTSQPAVNFTALHNNCADLAGIYYGPGESKNPPGLVVEHYALLNSVESLKQTFNVNKNWHYLVSNEICTMNFMIELPDFPTGQNINSHKAVILDNSKHLLLPGAAGEVYIDGLWKQYGYLNRPGLTALQFIQSPFDESRQKTLFLTGKIGKYLDTGDIVLVEMKDEGAEQEERCVEPANEKEQKILAIWGKILGQKIPGVTANFFQVGGSSIEALLLVTEINKTFKRQLSITDIYENESIREQAALVEQTTEPDKGEKSARDKNIFRLKVGSRGSKNIFLIHDGTGEVDKYRLFCKELKSRDNYWGLPLKSAPASGLAPQELEIEDLASEHLTTIKQVQARGPYYLGGWSIGGLIAFEITRQLEQAGEHVDRLYMFDTAVPVKKTPSPQPFDLPGELELLNRFFQVPVTVTAGFKAANPEELWQEFLNFIENDETYNQGYIVDKLAIYSELISDFGKLPAAELFKYVNRFRSTTSAGSKYYPGTKIKAKLHYYQTELSNQDAAKWQDFFTGKIDLQQTQGNHFNMFNRPHLQYLISLFEKHSHTG